MKFFGLLSIVASCFLNNVHAGELWLDINGASYHTQKQYFDGWQRKYDSNRRYYVWKSKWKDYNSANYGAGLTYEFNDHLGVKGGFYNNSYYKWTTYAAVNLRHKFKGPVSVIPNISVGVVTGYDVDPLNASTIQPMAIPGVALELNDKYRLNVGYIPGRLLGDIDVYTASLEIKLF